MSRCLLLWHVHKGVIVKRLSLLLVDSKRWGDGFADMRVPCAGLVCFGTSGRGQSDVPHASVTGYRPYEAVACGRLAPTLRSRDRRSAQATCTLVLPPLLDSWCSLATTASRQPVPLQCAIALRDVSGVQGFGQCSPPPRNKVQIKALCAGFGHSCVLDSEGETTSQLCCQQFQRILNGHEANKSNESMKIKKVQEFHAIDLRLIVVLEARPFAVFR